MMFSAGFFSGSIKMRIDPGLAYANYIALVNLSVFSSLSVSHLSVSYSMPDKLSQIGSSSPKSISSGKYRTNTIFFSKFSISTVKV